MLANGAEDEEDGPLSAQEVMEEWELGAGCTGVLSACETARGAVREEGVVGLARAFLAAQWGAGSAGGVVESRRREHGGLHAGAVRLPPHWLFARSGRPVHAAPHGGLRP